MSIAIVGAGISGVQLGLMLQAKGIDATIYTDKSGEQIRAGGLLNTVCRFGPCRTRERALGVNHWDGSHGEMLAAEVAFQLPQPFGFTGHLPEPPGHFLDFRIYLSRLLEDFEDRGGEVVIRGPLDAELVAAVAPHHDLVVAATGRGTMADLFPRNPARSTRTDPARILTCGLFRGIAPPPHHGLVLAVIPGVGEVFNGFFHSFEDGLSSLLFEAAPGGPLEALNQFDVAADPGGFNALALSLLTELVPTVRERIDTSEFALARPVDVLQGAITPTVRHMWAAVGDRHALAIGDLAVVNDPIGGQGANLGSRAAAEVADLVAAGGPFDEAFCRRADERLWAAAEPVIRFNDALLDPPTPQLLELMMAASSDQAVADAWVATFNAPQRAAAALASSEGAAAFLAGVRPTDHLTPA